MKKGLKNIFIVFLMSWAFDAIGQQFPISSHYTVNPYSLNPAFAGASNRSEFFMNYRRDWSSIPGSPQTYRINGNRRVYKNMYLGGELLGDQADIFYRLKAGLSFTYRLQIAHEQYLSFGLAGHLYQSLIRIDQTNADLNDPILRNLDRLLNTSYNTAFGLVYNRNKLFLGFGMPIMMRTKEAYLSNYESVFTFERAFDFYAGNKFDIDNRWEFQPSFVLRKTLNQPLVADFSGLFIYEKQLWLGVLYRSTVLFGLTAGASLQNGMLINYTYEVGAGGIHSRSGGTHEITLGIRKPESDARYNKSRTKRKDSSPSYQSKTQSAGKSTVRQNETREKQRVSKTKTKKQKVDRNRRSPSKMPKYAPYEKF
jgi:type IX secretion system PorP/SprF family membrane protein